MAIDSRQNPGSSTSDDGFDEDGYDESQRAEILETEAGGRSDGTIMVDLDPDMGGDEPQDDKDDEEEADGPEDDEDDTEQ